jgi:hypothetical protein
VNAALKPKPATGWVRYNICDRSGGGWKRDRWHFRPGIEQEGVEGIREEILRERESWALHAESFNFRMFLNETPPIELLAETITAHVRSIAAIQDEIKILERQISLKRELTTI